MTTEGFKLKAIQDAYGEYFEELKRVIDFTNGWCKHPLKKYFGEENIQSRVKGDRLIYRPKSLSGIETNNQWIRIEEDGSNLPNGNDADNFWICNENGLFDFFSYPEQIERKFRNGTVTHYQPVIKPKPPIY